MLVTERVYEIIIGDAGKVLQVFSVINEMSDQERSKIPGSDGYVSSIAAGARISEALGLSAPARNGDSKSPIRTIGLVLRFLARRQLLETARLSVGVASGMRYVRLSRLSALLLQQSRQVGGEERSKERIKSLLLLVGQRRSGTS